jgi:predicted metal-binding protein
VIIDLPARWRASILVCAKCEKKLDKKGFGPKGKDRLSKLLRKRFGGGKGRKAGIGVISTGCLKVCPRHAVTVVDGARPRDWLIVQAGTPIEQVEARLGLADTAAIAAE